MHVTGNDFVETVAAHYHREYSFVEYIQSKAMHSTEEVEECKKQIYRVANRFGKKISRIANATNEDSIEDIYAVTIRMELVYGVGEPSPVLGKLYFRNRGGVFSPIRKSEALKSEKFINEVIEKQNPSGGPQDSERRPQDSAHDTNIVDNVLNSVERIIAGKMAHSFTESILIAGEQDEKTIQKLISEDPGDNAAVECKKIKVLSISHIRWVDTAFDLFVDGQKTFLAKISPNGSMSWYCCCNSEDNKLIESNVVTCYSPDTGLTDEISLDVTDDRLGISDDAVEKIMKESAFAKHAVKIDCSELARRKIRCKQYRCECNTTVYDANGVQKRKCSDCPYPEVVLRYGAGEAACTSTLNFDTKTLQPVTEKVAICHCCGRTYATEKPAGNFYCDFCLKVKSSYESESVDPEARITYKKYAGMLPLSARFGAKDKYCFENEDRLIFIVGKNRYFFDKLKLQETGILEKPEKTSI